MTSPKIRRATRSDADFLAWVMLASSRSHVSRGIWDLIVGGDDDACLHYLNRLAVAEPRSPCHYDSFLIAEVDGWPASALTAFRPAEGGWALVAEAMANVQREVGWTEADVAASRQRLAPARACFVPDAGEDWCIEFVATLPRYRRRGFVDALIREAIQQGVERGCKLAQITILQGNDAAQAAYEKQGFKMHDERGSEEFRAAIGAPGFRSLMRKL
jgi:ribosomal protein S18 acetylase RimI-like enzyme